MTDSKIVRKHVGARMSGTAIFNDVVYLAGQVPSASLGGPAAEQTREVLQLIDQLLADAGSSKRSILSCQVFLRHVEDFAAMNEIWDDWVVPGSTPPRATLQAALMRPGVDVEMVVTAAVEF
jgi:enamine deaminase RidA (YjgF/YER057c/UK114 family)